MNLPPCKLSYDGYEDIVERHVVFVGSHDQYFQWWSLGHAAVWYEWELPTGDFSFEEVGSYGVNPAWRRMRKDFGFLPEELQEYENKLLINCIDRWPFVKKSVVRNDNRYVAHYHPSPGIPRAWLVGELYEMSSYDRSTIELEDFVHESGVILGAAGFCEVCQELLYYVRPR